jgi:large repetitive protein
MTHYRTAEQVKKFDIFKGITLGILVVLLFLAWIFFRPVESPSASTEAPTVEQVAAITPAATEPESDTETGAEVKIAAPTLDQPSGELTPGSVTLSGTGEPGSEVEVVVEGKPVGKATVGNDGKWSFGADLPASGDYQVNVQNVDASGNVLAASEAVVVKVAEVATEEAAPASAATAPALDLPSGELPAGNVNLTGTGEPGTEVQIVVDGEPVGRVTVDSEGKWSFPFELPDSGDYDISVQSLDASGAVVAASQAVAVKVSEATAGLTVPTIDLPSEGFPVGDITLTGMGEPGSEVQVVVDGQPAGKVMVDSAGKWSLPFELLNLGDHEISVQSVDASGEVLAASEVAVVQVTEAASEAEPAMTAPTLDMPSDELTVGEVTLTGTGEPGSGVEVVVDGKPMGTATVDSNGKWSLPTELTEPGDYEISVQSVDANGQVLAASEATELTLTKEAESAAPETSASSSQGNGEAYVVQADDWLSKIADKFYGDISAYPTIVEATNAKAKEDSSFTVIANPDLIEIGQKLWIPNVTP